MYAMLSLRDRATARQILEDLSHHLESLRHRFGEAARRPNPEGIWDNRTFVDIRRRLYALSQDDFLRFPMELRGVVRGDTLNAYFTCYPLLMSDKPVEGRVSMDDIPAYIDAFDGARHTPVTEWNLLQLNAARAFGGLVISPNAGVATPLVETFQTGHPVSFRQALDVYAPLRR